MNKLIQFLLIASLAFGFLGCESQPEYPGGVRCDVDSDLINDKGVRSVKAFLNQKTDLRTLEWIAKDIHEKDSRKTFIVFRVPSSGPDSLGWAIANFDPANGVAEIKIIE